CRLIFQDIQNTCIILYRAAIVERLIRFQNEFSNNQSLLWI
ncbi:unnamed protein product, partial [Heterotrigona itama]